MMPRPFLIFSQSDFLIQTVDTNSHTQWQTVQIQISWLPSQLIWIYTVCKGRTYPGSAGQGLNLTEKLQLACKWQELFSQTVLLLRASEHSWASSRNLPYSKQDQVFLLSPFFFIEIQTNIDFYFRIFLWHKLLCIPKELIQRYNFSGKMQLTFSQGE